MEPGFSEYSCEDSILTSRSEDSSIIFYNLIYCNNNYHNGCVVVYTYCVWFFILFLYLKCSPQILKWFCLKPDLSRFLRKAHRNNSPQVFAFFLKVLVFIFECQFELIWNLCLNFALLLFFLNWSIVDLPYFDRYKQITFRYTEKWFVCVCVCVCVCSVLDSFS